MRLHMSVHVQSDSVNATALKHDEVKSPLTPGQVAIVTIGTTFLFYMAIMFMVCIGEYCKYNKRRKAMSNTRRVPLPNNSAIDTCNNDADIQSSSISQSDYTSSFQAQQSASLAQNQDTSQFNRNSKENGMKHLGVNNDDEIVEIPFEESLNAVKVDFSCDNFVQNGDQNMLTKPLLSPNDATDTVSEYNSQTPTKHAMTSKVYDDVIDADGEHDIRHTVIQHCYHRAEHNECSKSFVATDNHEHSETINIESPLPSTVIHHHHHSCVSRQCTSLFDKPDTDSMTKQCGANSCKIVIQIDGCHGDQNIALLSQRYDDVTDDVTGDVIEHVGEGMVMERLMSQPSDDTMDNDSEIVCDTTSSRDSRLEADV